MKPANGLNPINILQNVNYFTANEMQKYVIYVYVFPIYCCEISLKIVSFLKNYDVQILSIMPFVM